MTDCEWILEQLRKGRELTVWACIQERGCTKASNRIGELRRKGYKISSRLVTGKNRRGQSVHYSVYRLEAEPEETENAKGA